MSQSRPIHRLDKAVIEDIKTRYLAKEPIKSVAKRHGISNQVVINLAVDLGIYKPRRVRDHNFSGVQKEEIQLLVDSGAPYREIGERYGVSWQAIRYLTKRTGTLKNRHYKNSSNDSRRCVLCKVDRELDAFPLQKGSPLNRAYTCNDCIHLTKAIRVYGLSEADYKRIHEEADGKCSICKSTNQSGKRLYIDHCHDTGQVRNLLCLRCNSGLGRFKDSADLMRRAADYLDSPTYTGKWPCDPAEYGSLKCDKCISKAGTMRYCANCIKFVKIRGNFKLSKSDFLDLRNKQNGVCAVCGGMDKQKDLAIDHDHVSGRVRGLLCGPCNTGIGYFNEDPELLRKAADFIA